MVLEGGSREGLGRRVEVGEEGFGVVWGEEFWGGVNIMVWGAFGVDLGIFGTR